MGRRWIVCDISLGLFSEVDLWLVVVQLAVRFRQKRSVVSLAGRELESLLGVDRKGLGGRRGLRGVE
jgi:hypothetical protein